LQRRLQPVESGRETRHAGRFAQHLAAAHALDSARWILRLAHGACGHPVTLPRRCRSAQQRSRVG
jgi:hypothetical protein